MIVISPMGFSYWLNKVYLLLVFWKQCQTYLLFYFLFLWKQCQTYLLSISCFFKNKVKYIYLLKIMSSIFTFYLLFLWKQCQAYLLSIYCFFENKVKYTFLSLIDTVPHIYISIYVICWFAEHTCAIHKEREGCFR